VSDKDSPSLAVLFVGAAIAAVLATIALFVAVIRSPSQLWAPWLLWVVAIAIALIAVSIAIASVWACLHHVLEEVARLDRNHKDLVRWVRRSTPTGIAITSLIAEVAVLLADSAFDGDTVPTVATSILLIVALGLGNELIEAKGGFLRLVGWLLWYGAVALLPLLVMVYHGWVPAEFVAHVQALPLPMLAACALPLLLICAAPGLRFVRREPR